VGGYNITGSSFDMNICLETNQVEWLCTIDEEETFDITQVNGNLWNKWSPSPATAGMIGLGVYSNVWELVGTP
jgi:hypothetical protein